MKVHKGRHFQINRVDEYHISNELVILFGGQESQIAGVQGT